MNLIAYQRPQYVNNFSLTSPQSLDNFLATAQQAFRSRFCLTDRITSNWISQFWWSGESPFGFAGILGKSKPGWCTIATQLCDLQKSCPQLHNCCALWSSYSQPEDLKIFSRYSQDILQAPPSGPCLLYALHRLFSLSSAALLCPTALYLVQRFVVWLSYPALSPCLTLSAVRRPSSTPPTGNLNG